jgi:hypothetical protein
MFDMAASPCIQCRIDPQIKLRLQAIAIQRGLTESAVLKRLVIAAVGMVPAGDASVLVVKAVSEQGVRLNIRKATLRDWRRQFATHLREQGIPANATERAVRGASRVPRTDGVFRSDERDSSTYVQERLNSFVRRDRNQPEPGRAQLVATRRTVEQGWYAVHDVLEREGYLDVARDIRRFLAQMQPPLTERERITLDVITKQEAKRKAYEPRTR